ncbi:T9SS type A sorting domain-containing protein [Pedobacter helvus]|uniref:T9SS type A sorting domain-containing protein n=1 Tax=Pedobacter helvus TaxID=2563444 RepID=A0ABW9JNH4_9SPHI|nr:T9SS type A sorting domain-containing protein [Pedobacter ureilyticus]
MNKIFTTLTTLFLLPVLGVYAQAPLDIVPKATALSMSDIWLDGRTKFSGYASSYLVFGGDAAVGSVVDNKVVINAASKQYFVRFDPTTTDRLFDPSSNYTIQFKSKVSAFTLRALEIVIRDGISQSPTLVFRKEDFGSHASGVITKYYEFGDSEKDVENVFTIAVKRGTPNVTPTSYHFYINGAWKYTFNATASNVATNRYITFGQQQSSQTINAEISYFTVDLTGAYSMLDAKVLPVELLSFEAKKGNNGIQLSWETASETNNSHYELERSPNGAGFDKIVAISAKGAGSYAHTDVSPLAGTNYYRLVQVDRDGTRTDLGVKTVKYTLSSHANVYPNPVKAGAILYVDSDDKDSILMLTDIAGKILYQGRPQTVNGSRLIINLPLNINRGLYFLSNGSLRSKIFVN